MDRDRRRLRRCRLHRDRSNADSDGHEQDVNSNGATAYSAWWEVVPGPSLTITSLPVHPGDRISASIAEQIPNSNVVLGTSPGFAAQPKLTSPAFDHALVNGAPANLKPSEEIQLIDGSGRVIGTPSPPDPDADGFNVCAWSTSCSPPRRS